MERPRSHLKRQLFVLAVIVGALAFVLWPRSTPDCSKSTGDGGVHLSLPRSVDHLGLVITCKR